MAYAFGGSGTVESVCNGARVPAFWYPYDSLARVGRTDDVHLQRGRF